MSTRFHIGAKKLLGEVSAYAKRFDHLEVHVGLEERRDRDKLQTVPKLATLKRWRKAVTPHFTFGVVAGLHVSKLKASKELTIELDAAKAAIDALEARCFILRTPAEVTPAPVWRDRLAKLVEPFPRDATHIIWEPTGIWDTGEAAVLAKQLKLVLAVDASREPVPVGPIAYVRLRSLGETRSYGTTALSRIVDAVGERRDAFVVIESDSAMKECKELRRIVQRNKTAARGGMGPLIRPRGAIVVGDDEQE